jgi:hypothetical protein
LFQNLFWGDREPYGVEQERAFYGWLKTGFEALRIYKFQPGQALAMAGPPDAGKSLTQQIITEILGGRSAKAAMFLQGRTDFNSDLLGAEHLTLEDEHASTSYAARRELASALKNITANSRHPCHAKHRDIVHLCPWWRVTISLNDQPERLLILPNLDADNANKLILLRADCYDMPMPCLKPEEKHLFWRKLLSELPAFLHWLVNDYQIPCDCSDSRFGIKSWHNPALVAALQELSPAMHLLELIDRADIWEVQAASWEGEPLQLRALLFENPRIQRDAAKLLGWQSACGQYLAELAKIRPMRVKLLARSGHRCRYEICREITL